MSARRFYRPCRLTEAIRCQTAVSPSRRGALVIYAYISVRSDRIYEWQHTYMNARQAGAKRRSRIDPTVLASLIGGATTLIAAFVGVLLGNNGVFVNVLPGNPTKVVTVSPSPQSAVTVTVTASSGSGSVTQSQPSGIYHQGRLVLVGSTSADLDAPPSDRQWGEINLEPGDQYDVDANGNTSISLYNGAQGVQLGQTTGNSCASATGYSSDTIGDTSPLTIGQLICIRTTEGRFSLLKILGLPDGEIVMYVTTYAKTGT